MTDTVKTVPFFRNPYNYDTNQASIESGLACEDPSLAVQSQAEEADINVIVQRFGVTGKLPQSLRLPEYGDFTGPSSFHEAQTYVVEAEGAFLALPAALRAEFNNDPGEFLAYVEHPDNREAVRETFGIEIEGWSTPPSPATKSEGQPDPGTKKSPPPAPPSPEGGA